MRHASMLRAVRHATIAASVLALAACGADSGTTSDANGHPDADHSDGTSVTDANFDGASGDTAHDAADADTACAIIQAQAGIVRRPLDVIMVIDSTSTFSQPRMTISGTLASTLIMQLEANAIDYRVIVVGGMITAPAPTTPTRYFYVSEGVGSRDLLGTLPGHFRSALPYLRTDSLKAIIDFTDAQDSNSGTRAEYDTAMSASDLEMYFGTPTMPTYYLHAVAGLANNTPSSTPWPPSAPIVTTQCSGFTANPCPPLQQISIDTGGYRFALCNFAEYGSFFDAVAQQAISGTRVPCEFGQPTAADGSMPDIQYAVMTLADGMGAMSTYHDVADMSACGDGFYLVPGSGSTPGRVVLCPATCATVQATPNAMVTFAFACPPG